MNIKALSTAFEAAKRKALFLKAWSLALAVIPALYLFDRSSANSLLTLWIPIFYLLHHLISKSWPLRPLGQAGLGLLFLLWLPSVFTLGLEEAWREGRMFLFGLLALSAAAETVEDHPGYVRWYAAAFSMAGLFLGADALYQFFSGHDLLGQALQERAAALLANPNYLGFFLAGAFPMSLLAMRSFRSMPLVFVFSLAAVTAVAGVVLSGARSAWIATFVSMIFAIRAMRSERKVLMFVFGLVMASVVLAIFMADDLILQRINHLLAAPNARLRLWRESVTVIGWLPALGLGIGTWVIALPPSGPTFPHNFFLEVALASGIPAAIVFVYVCLSVVFWLYRMSSSGTGMLIVSAVVALFIGAVINIPFFSRHFSTIFWPVLGIAIGYGMSLDVPSQEGEKDRG